MFHFGWRNPIQVLIDRLKRFHSIMGIFGPHTPNFHMSFPLVSNCSSQGNPWKYMNFFDESLNSTLKRASRLCHQATFEATLLRRMSYLLEAKRGAKRNNEKQLPAHSGTGLSAPISTNPLLASLSLSLFPPAWTNSPAWFEDDGFTLEAPLSGSSQSRGPPAGPSTTNSLQATSPRI